MEDVREIREIREILARLKAGQVAVVGEELCCTSTQALDVMLGRYQSPLLKMLLSQVRNLHFRLGQFSLMVLSLVLSWISVPDHRHFLCRIEATEKCFEEAISSLQTCAQSIDVSNVSLLKQILTSSEEIHIPGSRFPTFAPAVLQAYLSSIPSQSGDFTCLSTRVSIHTIECPGMQAWTVIQGILVPYCGYSIEKKEAKACVYESVWQK